MTTEQQYKAPAAMLPEKVKFYPKVNQLCWRSWKLGKQEPEVQDSELLGLCYEIEEGLTTRERVDYVQELKRGWSSPFFNWTHASSERRIEAPAKVRE